MASSPESASTWNSSDAVPPMEPVSARTDAEVQAHARRTCACRPASSPRSLRPARPRRHGRSRRPSSGTRGRASRRSAAGSRRGTSSGSGRSSPAAGGSSCSSRRAMIGDDFLVRGADDEVAVVAVLQAQQLRAVLVPAAGLLPQLGRLHRWHQQLERAGAVHFLADDGSTLRSARRPIGRKV